MSGLCASGSIKYQLYIQCWWATRESWPTGPKLRVLSIDSHLCALNSCVGSNPYGILPNSNWAPANGWWDWFFGKRYIVPDTKSSKIRESWPGGPTMLGVVVHH